MEFTQRSDAVAQLANMAADLEIVARTVFQSAEVGTDELAKVTRERPVLALCTAALIGFAITSRRRI